MLINHISSREFTTWGSLISIQKMQISDKPDERWRKNVFVEKEIHRLKYLGEPWTKQMGWLTEKLGVIKSEILLMMPYFSVVMDF